MTMHFAQTMSGTRARAHAALLSLLVLLVPALCRASVCEQPGKVSYVSAAVVDHGKARLGDGNGETDQRMQEFRIFRQGPGNLAFGYSHRYTTFDFAGIEPQTNAHLHTAAFPVHWRRGDRRRNFRVAIAPSLSTSSNVLGHPQRYSSDILQLALALVWQRQFSQTAGARYGLCGDTRFGRYRVYPTAVLEWQPHPAWQVDLGFPASRVTYRMSDALSTGLRATPDGSEWQVMNRNFDAESRLIYESYAIEWLVTLETGHLTLAAGFGRQLQSEFEMTLQSGQRVTVDSEAVNRVSAELSWRF